MSFLRRHAAEAAAPIALPARGTAVTIGLPSGQHLPGRVDATDADSLLVAILVPLAPLQARELAALTLLFNNAYGRISLSGEFSLEDPRRSELLRIRNPRSIEVLQEREYVRIKAARPVLVYRARDRIDVSSYTVDISGGGLCLAGPDNLKPGDEIQFRIAIQPGQPPVTGTGRVVRRDAQGRSAIRFEQLSDLERRRLVRFIFECQRIERRRGLNEEGASG